MRKKNRSDVIWLCVLIIISVHACTPGDSVGISESISHESSPMPIIIDTDMGADDVIAILSLLGREDIEVLAITIAATGLVDCEHGIRHATKLISLAGADRIPLACGRKLPIIGDRVFPSSFREAANGFYGMPVPGTSRSYEIDQAASLIIDVIEEETRPVHLLTLGPLTNIGDLLAQKTEIAEKITSITMMGGALDVPGNVSLETGLSGATNVEWNFYIDPVAVEIVMETDIEKTLVPLDATNQVPLTSDFYTLLKANQKTRLAEYVLDLLEENPSMLRGGFFLWDPLAAVSIMDTDLIEYENQNIDVELDSGDQAGRVYKSGLGNPVHIAAKVDPSEIEQEIIAALNGIEHEELVMGLTPIASNAARASLVWAFPVEQLTLEEPVHMFFPPHLTEDLVIFPGWDGKIHAVERDRGVQRWVFDPEGDSAGYLPTNGKQVFVTGSDGKLYALDIKTGEENWRIETEGKLGAPYPYGDLILAWDDAGSLEAFDQSTGEVIWEHELESEVAVFVQPPLHIPFTIADDTVFFPERGIFKAIDMMSGSVIWRYEAEEWVSWRHIISEDRVFIIDDGGQVLSIDSESGEVVWKSSLDSTDNLLLLSTGDDRLFVRQKSNKIIALDLVSGDFLWENETPYGINEIDPMFEVVDDDVLYINSSDWNSESGAISAFDIPTGGLIWTFDNGSELGKFAVYDDLIAFGTFDGEFLVINRNDGEIVAEFESGAITFSPPGLSDSEAYFLCLDGNFYAIAWEN
ncbi:MAG: hypothetical protein E3J69_03920 [Anaerolineales bacterium]|nr:MAG: hypothetical protein E3J69_03920 [Anaerolineales bacterium]